MKNCGKYEDNLNVIGPILREKRKEKRLQRTVRDYEISALSVVLDIDVSELLGPITRKFQAS